MPWNTTEHIDTEISIWMGILSSILNALIGTVTSPV